MVAAREIARDWMVAEACEYRANFLYLRPEIALVLGIEPDHFDYYLRASRNSERAFAGKFIRNTCYMRCD